jgi:hypothetical protein
MARSEVSWVRWVPLILAAWGCFAFAGCGGFKCVPVAGTLTLDGKPIPGYGIAFIPDTTKGNTEHVGCFGLFDSQGRYQLKADGVKGSEHGTGAPLGWYKVVLVDGLESMKNLPRINIHPKFKDDSKTPLSVEVVANPEPGHYDFKVTNK